MNKNVIVTGGAGYIGSHACKALARAGYTPITYDHLQTGTAEAVKWGPLEQGDVLDSNRLAEVFERYRPSAVMHFAAWIQVGESVENPIKYYRNNTFGSLNLLEAVQKYGVQHFIFSSTAAVYGSPDLLPTEKLSEVSQKNPINPYGQSKWMTEQVLTDLLKLNSFRAVTFRYFNAAGADPDGEIGSFQKNPSHLIPRVLEAALGQKSEITIFGTDWPTPDHTCIRDYIHVSDLADAHVAGLKFLEAGGASEVFNLGNGRGFSVKEVIETAKSVTGKEIPVKLGGRRPGDPAILIADDRKAKQALEWKSKLDDLSTIVQTTWDWMKKRN